MNVGRLIGQYDPTALTVDASGIEAPINRQELVWVAALDNRDQVKDRAFVRVAMGGVSVAEVHLVPVLHVPIMVSADRMLLVHSHPSGDLTISDEDRDLTRAVMEAAATCGITLVDHVIVAPDGGSVSLVAAGVLAPLPVTAPQAAQ
jgi:DNA repair protein RadC